MKHLAITVSGRVQGVWFRASTKDAADRLGITGFVKNLPDGAVYLEAEGEADTLDELITWLHTGPPLAKVTEVVVADGECRGFDGFEIRR